MKSQHRRSTRESLIILEQLEDRVLLSNTNILVVYNAGYTGDLDGNGVQDSLQVAQYYALKRQVPAGNLLGVNPNSSDTLTYADFKTQVAQPVQDKLTALGKSGINYILMIYGMPWRLDSNYSLDNAMASPEYALTKSAVFSTSNPYLEANPLYTSSGTYDGGASDKGHFTHSYTVGGKPMYLVSRLDGPVDSALGIYRITNLVDQALYAEKYISTTPGYLNGTMYVSSPYPPNTYTVPTTDSDIKTGNYNTVVGAQKNIGYAGRYAESYGVTWANLGSQNNNAFMYSGWLNYDYYSGGRQYQWLPGGTGVDLNSNTFGWSIRATGTPAWATLALADGITATCGVTNEPYVNGHTRPNILNYYLLKGYTFGEAASLASPNIGWMELNIGDPLYAPFAPKTNVVDNVAPVFVAGYPRVDWATNEGYVVNVLLNDQVNPEAATVKVDFGLTTAYGQTKQLTQYYLHHRVSLGELLASQTYHYRVTVTDPAGNVTVSPDATFQTGAQTPYGGTAWPVPGTVQCENFDVGGEGLAYHDTEPQDTYNYRNPRAGDGVEVSYYDPISVWFVKAGEWLEYTVNVAQSGRYTLDVNSQANSAGNQFHVEVDGVNVTGVMTSPASVYGLSSQSGIAVSAGTHVVRLVFDLGVGDGWVGNFDWFQFTFESALDMESPAVSLTGPSDGVIVRGNVNVTASASDNVGVAGVQFKLDGNVLGPEDLAAPYAALWDTTAFSNGPHTLTAVARDAAGNTTTSSGIHVIVDNAPPAVVLSGPQDNVPPDFDSAAGVVRLTYWNGPITIDVKDLGGSGIDPTSVLSSNVLVTLNGQVLSDGTDYSFNLIWQPDGQGGQMAQIQLTLSGAPLRDDHIQIGFSGIKDFAGNTLSGTNCDLYIDHTPPTVQAVIMNGGVSTRSFVKLVGVQFSEALAGGINSAALTLHNDTTGQDINPPAAGFSYDGATNTCTWNVWAANLPGGNYTATLHAQYIFDLAGNLLSGGSDQTFTFYRLRGDVDGDRVVGGSDYSYWLNHFGTATTSDFDGDGLMGGSDYTIWLNNFGRSLAAGGAAMAPSTVLSPAAQTSTAPALTLSSSEITAPAIVGLTPSAVSPAGEPAVSADELKGSRPHELSRIHRSTKHARTAAAWSAIFVSEPLSPTLA